MSDGACAAPPTRTCQIYPASCGEGTFRTLCGCDGKTHAVAPCPGANPIDVDSRAGSCPPTAGMFSCGDAGCKVGAQYCSESVSGAACVDAPAACMGAQATCACLATMGLKGCGCVDEPGGGVGSPNVAFEDGAVRALRRLRSRVHRGGVHHEYAVAIDDCIAHHRHARAARQDARQIQRIAGR